MRRILLMAVVLFACDSRIPSQSPDFPPATSKADDAGSVVARGALLPDIPGEVVTMAPAEAWTLDLIAGATLEVEVTQSGTSRNADLAMALYGPEDPAGARALLATDDDSGFARLPRITATVATTGLHTLTLLRKSSSEVHYRVVAHCRDGICTPPPEPCDPVLLAIMRLCARESATNPYDAAVQCGEGQPPTCAADLLAEAAYRECVFGTTWYELGRSPWIRVDDKQVLAASTPLDATERARVVTAVQASSHTDVTTSAEAFDRVDDNVIDRYELIDTSANRVFVAYVYGAGDNTYGRIFDDNGVVTDIHDGDLMHCDLAPGLVGTDCASPTDCPSQLTCTGITAAAGGLGRCGPSDSHQFICRGTTCTPAWLERDIRDVEALPLSDLPFERELVAYGLGEHLVAAELTLSLEHPHADALEIILTAPNGTQAIIPTTTATATALELRLPVALATPANGRWKLRIAGPAGVGMLHTWSLRLSTE